MDELQVQQALAHIRPAMQADGGDIELVSVEDGFRDGIKPTRSAIHSTTDPWSSTAGVRALPNPS